MDLEQPIKKGLPFWIVWLGLIIGLSWPIYHGIKTNILEGFIFSIPLIICAGIMLKSIKSQSRIKYILTEIVAIGGIIFLISSVGEPPSLSILLSGTWGVGQITADHWLIYSFFTSMQIIILGSLIGIYYFSKLTPSAKMRNSTAIIPFLSLIVLLIITWITSKTCSDLGCRLLILGVSILLAIITPIFTKIYTKIKYSNEIEITKISWKESGISILYLIGYSIVLKDIYLIIFEGLGF